MTGADPSVRKHQWQGDTAIQQLCIYCLDTFPRPADTPPWEPARACHRPLCQERDREYRAEIARGAAAVAERNLRKLRRAEARARRVDAMEVIVDGRLA